MYQQLPAELMVSSGLGASDCADIDNCVAVLKASGKCVCYSSS